MSAAVSKREDGEMVARNWKFVADGPTKVPEGYGTLKELLVESTVAAMSAHTTHTLRVSTIVDVPLTLSSIVYLSAVSRGTVTVSPRIVQRRGHVIVHIAPRLYKLVNVNPVISDLANRLA
jgi:hypothetical protein